MKTNIVVSNVRMPYEEWQQTRIHAAEMGMSVNEYIRYIINHVSTKNELIPPKNRKISDYPIWKIHQLSAKKKKGKGLSIDDKAIYGEK